jgi:hypothetical protein
MWPTIRSRLAAKVFACTICTTPSFRRVAGEGTSAASADALISKMQSQTFTNPLMTDKCVLVVGPFRGHIVEHNDAHLRSDHRTPDRDLQQQQSPKVSVTAMEEQDRHIIGEKFNRADCEGLAFQLSQKAPAQ